MAEGGRETGVEWNTSEISASTSVFDISQSLSEEASYTNMSKLVFEGNSNISLNGNRASIESKAEQTAIFRAVPTDESIVADNVAAWECAEASNENIKVRALDGKTVTMKTRKRKLRKSLDPIEKDLSLSSESSENSIEYSAVLLAKGNQLVSSEERSELINSSEPLKKVSLLKMQTVNKSISNDNFQILESFKRGETSGLNLLQRNLNTNMTGEKHLNSTCSTSDNSYHSDSSSNFSNINNRALDSGKNDSSTMSEKNQGAASALPPIPEEKVPTKKQKKKSLEEDGMKKVVKAIPKTKSKGTQVNVKTKLVNINPKPKKKRQRKVNHNSQVTEMGNNQTESNYYNNMAVTELPSTSVQSEPSELTQLVKRVENLLEMPGMSSQASGLNTMSETLNVTSTLPSEAIQNGSEIMVSKSCSIKIVKDANNAQQISITLPAETSLSFSKKKVESIESRTPIQGRVKLKQEKLSPATVDLTLDESPINIKQEKEDDKKGTRKHYKKKDKASVKNETKRKKKSPSPQVNRNRPRVACGYMSSTSSESRDSEESSCNCSYCAGYASDSCSCSECNRSCDCSYCARSSSCSCSACCSESSDESPRWRRRRR